MKKEVDPAHAVDPHHGSDGIWRCYACGRKLKGSFMRPALPWEHVDGPEPKVDPTPTPDLSKEGS